MEVQVNSLSEWKKIFPGNSFLLFDDPDFIALIAESYHKSVSYYSVYERDKALLSLPILSNGKDASLVTHFFYQSIIKHKDFNELKLIEIWELLVGKLKHDFDTIQFKFPPYVFDIRPLQWAGFSHKVYYTSVIDFNKGNEYSTNVVRGIKKALNHGLKVVNTPFSESIFEEQLKDMIRNGLGKKESLVVRKWVKSLADKGNTRFFEMLDKDAIRIASSIYLLDNTQAYLLCTMGGDKNMGGQALLYDQAIQYFKNEGKVKVDLLGANIPSVALYKSKLGAELESYTIVTYRRYPLWYFIKTIIKKSIKFLLKSFRLINK